MPAVGFVLGVGVGAWSQEIGAPHLWERPALVAIIGGLKIVLDRRSQLSVWPWVLGQGLCRLREVVQVEEARLVDGGVAPGEIKVQGFAFVDVFQDLGELRPLAESEHALFFHVLFTSVVAKASRLVAARCCPRAADLP